MYQMKNHLKEKRKKAGLSQYQLSKLAGISQATISHIERGMFIPTIDTAYRVAAVLGVRVDDIFVPEPGELPKTYDAQEDRINGRTTLSHPENQHTARIARHEPIANTAFRDPPVHRKMKHKK